MYEQGGLADPGPGEVGCGAGLLPAVVQAYPDPLVHVVGRGLRDQQSTRGEHRRDPTEQGTGVAADPDVAVDEQAGSPAALVRERLEHTAPERRSAGPPGASDGGLADVDAQGPASSTSRTAPGTMPPATATT
nr:hypothetical protein [Streptomyces sp. FT05W]